MTNERKAWFCPSCQKHHAPHVDTCPAVGESVFPFTPFHPKPWGVPDTSSPYYPEWMKGTSDPCADCKGSCGNVACPRRLVITCDTVAYGIGTALS